MNPSGSAPVQVADIADLISRTAVLMEQFDRRCGVIEQRLHAQSDELQQLGQQLPAIVRQSAEHSLHAIPGLLLDRLGGELERPAQDYRQRLHDAGVEAETAARRLAGQLAAWQRLQRMLLWKTLAATATCLALLLAGGSWLAIHYTAAIRHHPSNAEWLEAYRRADVTLCDRRLCANVEPRGKRYGSHGQYLPIKLR